MIEPSERFGKARGVRPSLDLLEVERNELEILLVRPRVGAWFCGEIKTAISCAGLRRDSRSGCRGCGYATFGRRRIGFITMLVTR